MLAIAAAAALAFDAGFANGKDCVQTLGGIGFTWEHDLHLFLKRAQLDQVSFGDSSYHRERLAALLRPRVEAGESIL